jgi:hypothetical protein
MFPWSALQRSRLWPDSSVAARQTFEQRQLLPSQIKKACCSCGKVQRAIYHCTTTDDDNRHHRDPSKQKSLAGFLPSRSHQQKSLTGFLIKNRDLQIVVVQPARAVGTCRGKGESLGSSATSLLAGKKNTPLKWQPIFARSLRRRPATRSWPRTATCTTRSASKAVRFKIIPHHKNPFYSR